MAANDLTTVQSVKEFLNIKNDTDDTLLARLVTAVSVVFETFASRTFKSASYSHTFDGGGSYRQMLRQFPVTAVTSVTVDGVAIPAAATVTASGFRFDARSVILNGYKFSTGFQNVTISYTAGLSAIPSDLEQACIEQVAYIYRNRGRMGEASKGLAGETTTYITKALLDTVKAVLEQYKNRVPV